MAKFVPDVTTNRWVIIAPGRVARPGAEQKRKSKICPFCPSNEKLSGLEVYRIGKGVPNTPGWEVRVIANKYPITDYHEVIIHSPDDKKDIDQLSHQQVVKVFTAYRDRYNFHQKNGHVLIFNNVGEEGGASISHPHSQLVVVPKQINLDTLTMEPFVNIVFETGHFTVFCPDFSQWPYEVWIAPKKRNGYFGEISDEAISDLGEVLQKVLKKLLSHLGEKRHYHLGMPMIRWREGPAYNYYIHYGKDWYLRIIPRLVHRAGFELGTGLLVNIVDPEDAAGILREDH